MQAEIRRKTKLYAIAAILMAVVLGTTCYSIGLFTSEIQPPNPPSSNSGLLRTFSSYEELRQLLMKSQGAQRPIQSFGPWDNMIVGTSNLEALKAEGAVVNPPGIDLQSSPTNIQVAGVDEADIVKTHEGYIYVVSGGRIIILKAYPPEEAEIVSQITLDDAQPLEIFVSGERLAVLGSQWSVPLNGYYGALFVNIKTFVSVYDISDKTTPTFLTNFTISGSYFNSRMIGDYVYFVASQPAYVIYDTIILPKIYTHEGVEEIRPSQIYYSNASDNYYLYTTVVALNIQNVEEDANTMTLMLGGTSNMYVSLNNIYVTFPEPSGQETSIYRIGVQGRNMTNEAQGKVSGRELNQFSMDEYGDYFRIATATWSNGTLETNLYVLDMNLTIVGKLEGIAPNETLDSARFIENRCYLSTSVIRKDPFFVIDVENATDPKILGYLKIPGFTRYIHPYDADHVIGVGKDGSNVKVSLFDVTNVSAPTRISEFTVEGFWSDALVLTDHKAFLFEYSKNLLAIPVTIGQQDLQQYWIWQGLYVFDITLGDGLVLRGSITHQEYGADYWDSSYQVKRSLYIENVLYTVSDRKMKLNSLEDLTLLREIPFS